MISECKSCGRRITSGPFPANTMGCLVFYPAAVLLGMEIGILLGRLSWPWIALLSLPLSAANFAAVVTLPPLLEYLAIRRKACPVCGAKRWRFPFTDGFGV